MLRYLNEIKITLHVGYTRMSMITNFFFCSDLDDMNTMTCGFSTIRTVHTTLDFLHQRGSDVNYPQISCELTALDFFIWNVLSYEADVCD